MSKKPPTSIQFIIPGIPKSKENKGQFNKRSYYFKKYPELIAWEDMVNSIAISAMKDAGYPGPYKGRCKISATFTYESWKRCDITNYWKSLNDALNGAVWMDDSQVDAAEQVRQVDRDNPNIAISISFYDFSFEEEYPKKKYPDVYNIFYINSNGIKTDVKVLTDVADIPEKRFGQFIPFKERVKAKKKVITKLPSYRRIPTNEKAKLSAESDSGKKRGDSCSGKKSTTRRRKVS
jgi:Holliday junction resolvase RusA-like endonuclease